MIKKAEFIKSITDYREALTDLPSILLLGRSNVGKSSFINAMTNRKSLARVSATPGKTITLNYYKVDESMYFVDAPGYGYARRSKTQKADFIKMIDEILNKLVLRFVFLLVDFKVGPTVDDLEMYDYLLSLGKNVVIVCTKYDKVISSQRSKQEKLINDHFKGLNNICFTSSTKKIGYEKLYGLINGL